MNKVNLVYTKRWFNALVGVDRDKYCDIDMLFLFILKCIGSNVCILVNGERFIRLNLIWIIDLYSLRIILETSCSK